MSLGPVEIPTAADVWAELSTGERTDRPYPDVSRTLIPANAIHNHCFVAYANRCGVETVDGREMAAYLGNSTVAGPQVAAAVDSSHKAMGELQKVTLEQIFAMRRVLRPDQAARFDATVVKALTEQQH